MEHTILLIGTPDWGAIQAVLLGLTHPVDYQVCVCADVEKAKAFLRRRAVEFFVLDVSLGCDVCTDFLAWLCDGRPIYGFFLGDQIDNTLAINGLNTHLIMDALLRPVSRERWMQALSRWNRWRGQ